MPSSELHGIVPDDVPRRGLFTEPLRVERIETLPHELVGRERVRVSFRVLVRDADGKRCPDLAVEARIRGPERAGAGLAHTDLMGQVRFRMEGPPGHYELELIDVAAGGMTWDRHAGPLKQTLEASLLTAT